MNDSDNDLPASIGNPAKNALLAANIITLKQVAELSDKELLALHGVGRKAVRILREHIKEAKTQVKGETRCQTLKP